MLVLSTLDKTGYICKYTMFRRKKRKKGELHAAASAV